MKKVLFLIPVLLIVLAACQPNVPEDEETDSTEILTQNGYWILSEHLDSIIKDQAIARHREYPLAWRAFVLHIEGDSMLTTGLMYERQKISIKGQDTFRMTSGVHEFLFYYNQQLGYIEAWDNSRGNVNKYAGRKFHYRRITEKYLTDLFDNYDRRQMVSIFTIVFIDNLIAGNYKSLSNGDTLSLSRDRSVKGFGNFTSYHIDEGFGTHHPFKYNDAICFEDTNAVVISPTDNAVSCFNWSFSGDTLRLKEMLMDETGYREGNKRLSFVRIKEKSPLKQK